MVMPPTPAATGVIVVGLLSGASARSALDVDFARLVHPILTEHCFSYHGPEEVARGAHLRLDREESGTKGAGRIPRRPPPAPGGMPRG